MVRFATWLRVMPVLLLGAVLMLPAAPAMAQTTATDDDVVYEVLAEGTNEPMQLRAAEDGRIIWVERDGTVNVLSTTGVATIAGQIAVAGNLCETCIVADPGYTVDLADGSQRSRYVLSVGGPSEAGLYSVLLDDDFAQNDTLYLYYAVPGSGREVAPGVVWGDFRMSSFTLDPDTNLLDMDSEEELLTVRTEWDQCCHHGGDMEYLPDGTILLTTGDNVSPGASEGYGPRDARSHWTNAELTSANPADRRGKVLRLREDGTVPDGSLPGEMPNPFIGMEGHNPYIEDSADNVFVGSEFAGTPGDGWITFDPYVYAMGFKQPFRAMVMPNGDVYLGDVGPDAGIDDPERGPRGFEEINRVPLGGGTHHGWPRCQGPNWSYTDVDWVTMEVGGPLDCSDAAPVARPIAAEDTRAAVSGMTGAIMYYPSGKCDGSDNEAVTYKCDQWPITNSGTGGKTSEPTLFYPDDVTGPLALPARYRNRLFVMEASRNFIWTIPADRASGDLDLRNEGMDVVAPPAYSVNPNTSQPTTSVAAQQGRFMKPIDGVIGADGAYYFLEYGATVFVGENGRLSRIRGADAQLDPAANYGLPVHPAGAAALPAASGLPVPGLIGLALVGFTHLLGRRRRAARI